MKRACQIALLAGLWFQCAAQAGQLTLYTDDNFNGRALIVREVTPDLSQLGFNDRASSMVVASGRWELCVDAAFRGRCKVFETGQYTRLDGLNDEISSLREVGASDSARHGGQEQNKQRLIEQEQNKQLLIEQEQNKQRLIQREQNKKWLSEQGQNQQWPGEQDRNQPWRGEQGRWGQGRDEQDQNQPWRGEQGRRGHGPDERDQNQPWRGEQGRGEQGRGAMLELFSLPGFGGARISLLRDARNLDVFNFNDQAASIVIQGGKWEVCAHANFGGRCRVYGPGRYERLGPLDRQISSVRQLR